MSRSRNVFLGALSVLATFLSPSRAQTPVCEIDPTKSHGTWDGWGTSLCWWAKAVGDRDDIADFLFTMKTVDFLREKLPGLGMNLVRYNLGACSWSEVNGRKMVAGKIIKPFRQMEGFWLDGKSDDPQSKSWDWSVDKNQREMLEKARDRGANYFELFSNSPMWWMCKNNNPSGQPKSYQENLAPENYVKFVSYIATTARYAKDHWGITFTTVEPFNEPSARYWIADGKQEGCYILPKSQAAILPLLRAELDKRGLQDMPIAASDESTYDEAITTWKSFGSAPRAIVQQVNVHGYQNAGGHRDVLFDMVSKDGKRLWNSEYGEIDGTGLRLTQNLHLDFRYLRPTAWCFWQPFDGKGWGAIMADLPSKTFKQVNPKYYVFAQYARHIRPGMTILATGETESIAAYDPKGHKLAIVAHNLSNKVQEKTYDLSKFSVPDGAVRRWITEPKGSTRYEEHKDARVAGKRLHASLPASSIQTFEVENVTAP
jgi:galactan endo-1,6-beta-galactosidase